MSFGVKGPLKRAQKLKEFLNKKKLIDNYLVPLRTKNFIIFPINKKILQKNLPLKDFEVVKQTFKKKSFQPRNLKQALNGKISRSGMEHLISSFDIIGSVAVIEIPEFLKGKETIIAEALMQVNKNIETVAKIVGEHRGEFRVQPVKIIAGKKSLNTLHKEHGCQFKVNLEKVFYSPRLSTERKRISQLIEPGEKVGVFFAGVGPFAIIFAKNSDAEKIFTVELNKDAFDLMDENIKLNNVEQRVQSFFGDVKKIVPEKLTHKLDRVVMPLPKGGENFLKEAFLSLKSGGAIHFYQFEEKESLYDKPIEKLEETAKKFNKKIKILRKAVVRSFSPAKVQVVLDVLVK